MIFFLSVSTSVWTRTRPRRSCVTTCQHDNPPSAHRPCTREPYSTSTSALRPRGALTVSSSSCWRILEPCPTHGTCTSPVRAVLMYMDDVYLQCTLCTCTGTYCICARVIRILSVLYKTVQVVHNWCPNRIVQFYIRECVLLFRAFMMPADLQLELEYWSESGEFERDELHMMKIQDNKIFTISPKKGKLQPGDTTSVTFTYKHANASIDRLPVLLKLANGREILVNNTVISRASTPCNH